MKTKIWITIIGLIFGLWAQNLLAQDDDLDLLNELDEEITQEQDASLLDELDANMEEEEAKPGSPFLQLGKNFSGSIRLRGAHFFKHAKERPGQDNRNDVGEVLLKFSTWMGQNKWRINLDGWLEGGSQKDTYAGISEWPQDRSNRRKHAELNEIYLTISEDDFDLTAGKKVFSNGISTLYSPADRHKPKDLHDPLDSKDLGIWQIAMDYYYKDKTTFTAAIFPVYATSKNPDDSSRWTDSTGDENKDYEFKDKDDTAEVEDDYPDIKPQYVGYFARVKTTVHGWDLFASTYQGPNPYYVLKEEVINGTKKYIKRTVPVGTYAAGFSTTYKKWEFHGEGLYNHSYDARDDNYISYVGGFTYTFDGWTEKIWLEKIDLTIEYGGELVINDQKHEGYIKSSKDSRAGRNDLFTRVNFKYSEDLNFEYTSNFDFSREGRYNKFQSEYRITDGLVWTVAVELFNGESDSYYGRWKNNDRVITAFEYSF